MFKQLINVNRMVIEASLKNDLNNVQIYACEL